MYLIDDWRRIAKKAWSVRLMLLAAVLSGAEIVLPLFPDIFPRNVFAVLSFIVVVASMLARFVAQPRMHRD
jgi:hypothetical protein